MAIEGQTKPLEIARRLLRPETIREVLIYQHNEANLAYSILDRWALNSPELLKATEARSIPHLFLRLEQQKVLEATALNSEEAFSMSRHGMSNWEILEQLGVDTELRHTELI